MFYNVQEQEEYEFVHTTDAEWDRAEASERGYHNTDSEWILTNRDVWRKNPYFTGTPTGRHPEDDYDYDDLEESCPQCSVLGCTCIVDVYSEEVEYDFTEYEDIPF